MIDPFRLNHSPKYFHGVQSLEQASDIFAHPSERPDSDPAKLIPLHLVNK